VAKDSAAASKANKVYTVGEYGWEGDNKNLARFLKEVEENEDVAGDMYWSFFPHSDDGGYVDHNDGYTLHYPGNTLSTTQVTHTPLRR
jgi:mannan endo-1,4-beta-mannosidase